MNNGIDLKSKIEVAPDGELSNWRYILDETDNTVTLTRYIGETATDVVVYGKYQLNGKTYDTKIGSNDNSSASYMFHNKTSIQTITFNEGIDTSDVTHMDGMFYTCRALTSLDLRSFDTHNVTNMYGMFYDSSSLTKILVTEGKWIINEECDTSYMFDYCGVSEVTYA